MLFLEAQMLLEGEGKLRWEVQQTHFLILLHGWEGKEILVDKILPENIFLLHQITSLSKSDWIVTVSFISKLQ
jgi:hypothetical protein